MTLGVVLAVAAAAADRAQPVDGTLVAGLLQNYNKQCWLNHCSLEMNACVTYEPVCQQHFLCRQKYKTAFLDERMLEHCFGETRWQDLSNRELDVFSCAADNACVAPSHPALSFLEEEVKRRPESLAEIEDGSLDLNEEEENTVVAVMQFRAAVQRAKSELTRTQMMNTLSELADAKRRLTKLHGISHPTGDDVILGAAIERRLRQHDTRLNTLLRENVARGKERPLDIPYVAKLPHHVAIAPYAKELSSVLGKITEASEIRTRRQHKEQGKKFLSALLESRNFFANEFEKAKKQAQVAVSPDGHLRH